MKKGPFMLGAIMLLSACSPLEHAYFVDREFGQASLQSWDAQVLYPDYRYADQIPEEMGGITAEEIMTVHNKTFADRPTKSRIIEFGMGGSE